MRDPTADRERRRRENRRFIRTFGGLILAALVISILLPRWPSWLPICGCSDEDQIRTRPPQ
jgi:hypothetical protein